MKLLRFKLTPFLVLAFLMLSSSAQAQQGIDFTQNMFQKSVPMSFGGAFRALADTTATILYNPAGIAQFRGKVAAGGDYMHHRLTKSNAFSVAIVDFKASEKVGMGLSYDRDVFSVGNDVTVQMISASLATEVGPMINIGGTLKGYFSSISAVGADGPDGVDVDLGLLLKPIEFLSLAVTTHNLIRGHDVEEFPFQLGFGAALLLKPHARFAVDIVKDFESTGAAGSTNANFGGEIRATEGVFVRGGFGLDRMRDNNFYSIGLATVGPKVAAGFTFSQRLNPTYESYTANIEVFF